MDTFALESSVVIYDDHELFADSFAIFLERLGIFRSVLIAHDEKEVISLLISQSRLGRTYFFLDYYVRNENSIFLLKDAGRISKKIKTIIVSGFIKPSLIDYIITQKPWAIINKSSGSNVIIDCLNAIENNELYLCPVMQEYVEYNKSQKSRQVPFTSRELHILQYFAEGMSISETALKLNLSKWTIVNHRSNMMRKSGTKSIVDLLSYARNMGLI